MDTEIVDLAADFELEDSEGLDSEGLDHEGLRVLAMREGTEDLACWASHAMRHSDEMSMIYAEALSARLLAGAAASDIVACVRKDLCHARQADLVGEVATRYAVAVARASKRLVALKKRLEPVPIGIVLHAPRRHGFWGWSL